MVAENGDLLRRVWWAKHLGYVRFLTKPVFFLPFAGRLQAGSRFDPRDPLKRAERRNKAPNGSRLHDCGTKASRRACHSGQDEEEKT